MKTTENEHSVEYTRLPPELWLHILSFLRTAELLDVVCLSSTFYHLALPLLYENVSWVVSDEQAFLKSSPCTQALVREMLAMDGGTSQMGERRNGSLFEHVRACRIVRSFSSFAQSAARSRQASRPMSVSGRSDVLILECRELKRSILLQRITPLYR